MIIVCLKAFAMKDALAGSAPGGFGFDENVLFAAEAGVSGELHWYIREEE
jgi:hypothetical protein